MMVTNTRYRKEVYTKYDLSEATDCAIAECTKEPDPFWNIWVTVNGKEKRIQLCEIHGPLENQDERAYKRGW